LLAARTRSVKIRLRIARDLRRSALSGLNLIAQIAEPVGKLRLIDGSGKLLAVEITLRLNGACGAVRPLSHIEDDRMSMELRGGISIDRTGGVMLELCRNKVFGGFGGMVAADPRLRIPFQ